MGRPEWANDFLTVITKHDWGVPRVIINDKNPKFMSSFWRALFGKAGYKIIDFHSLPFSNKWTIKKDQSDRRNRIPVFLH